jgi:HD-GYP domain-containing protein (c-di-GMP phosphodiesterase class II)
MLAANQQQLPRSWRRNVEFGALLHDVGKLAVPWGLLNRVRSPTSREWAQLRQHAEIGEKMLRELGLPGLAQVVGEHHERPDGAGYPRGKKDPTLAASVVAVADAFEAMTSPSRIYTNPRSRQEAIEEVHKGAGAQFSENIANLLAPALAMTPRPSAV